MYSVSVEIGAGGAAARGDGSSVTQAPSRCASTQEWASRMRTTQ